MKCDHCNRPATVHMTEVQHGKHVERNLCEQCHAKMAGIAPKAHTPINELLTKFVMAHSGVQSPTATQCEHCGITWAEFRQNGLLGCAADYDQFEHDLAPLIERAHEGATHHVGKMPARHGGGAAARKATIDIARLRKELQRAVEAEDYERAAKVRDQIKQAEST